MTRSLKKQTSTLGSAEIGVLGRSSPSSQGVSARGIGAFIDELEAHTAVEPHSFMLLRHGQVVAEGWWAPYSKDRVQQLYSLSKTFLSTAVGFAVQEGLFSLDDFVADHFPQFRDELPAASRAIRIRHALAMASGHDAEMFLVSLETDPTEPVRGFLLHAPEHEPGSHFAYNQSANYAVAAILQQRAGIDLVSYLRPRLFDPLGIGPVSWQEHPPGRALGFGGLHATTEAVAKLGQLHLSNGMWEGKQLLPRGWAAEVRQKRVNTVDVHPDWAQGYGYQAWMGRHGYRGDGAYGQFCVVLPEQDVVLALTTAAADPGPDGMQPVLEMAWQHLLPSFDGDGDGDAADAALAERLSHLALNPSAGTADPSPGGPRTWQGDVFQAELSDNGICLSDEHLALMVPLPENHWTVVEGESPGLPVAISGGWEAATLHLDLIFLETPHRLFLDLLPNGSIRERWETLPLDFRPGAQLLAQSAPRPLH